MLSVTLEDFRGYNTREVPKANAHSPPVDRQGEGYLLNLILHLKFLNFILGLQIGCCLFFAVGSALPGL